MQQKRPKANYERGRGGAGIATYITDKGLVSSIKISCKPVGISLTAEEKHNQRI